MRIFSPSYKTVLQKTILGNGAQGFDYREGGFSSKPEEDYDNVWERDLSLDSLARPIGVAIEERSEDDNVELLTRGEKILYLRDSKKWRMQLEYISHRHI